MKAGQIAKAFEINVNTVRHYVRMGLLRPRKDESGYHQFGDEERRRLRFILSARELGFTLDDIAQLLSAAEDGASPCPQARDLIEQRLNDARAKLASLQALVQRMEATTQQWRSLPDCQPCGAHICHLIEGVHHEA